MIRIHRLKATFINVPKTGSTSVREFLIHNVVTPEDTVSYHNGNSLNIDSHRLNSHYTQYFCVVNNFCMADDTFFATVRNPLERMLSLYLYRWRQGKIESPSVTDFRRRLHEGSGWIQDHQPYQTQLQSEFLDTGTWWCYDRLDEHIEDLIQRYSIEVKVPFGHHNKSSSVPTYKLLDKFYDVATKTLVEDAQRVDFELYERVKNEYRKSSD